MIRPRLSGLLALSVSVLTLLWLGPVGAVLATETAQSDRAAYQRQDDEGDLLAADDDSGDGDPPSGGTGSSGGAVKAAGATAGGSGGTGGGGTGGGGTGGTA